MSRTKFLRFVREARALLPHATPQQKLKLVSLLKENIKRVENTSTVGKVLIESNADYLPEQ